MLIHLKHVAKGSWYLLARCKFMILVAMVDRFLHAGCPKKVVMGSWFYLVPNILLEYIRTQVQFPNCKHTILFAKGNLFLHSGSLKRWEVILFVDCEFTILVAMGNQFLHYVTPKTFCHRKLVLISRLQTKDGNLVLISGLTRLVAMGNQLLHAILPWKVRTYFHVAELHLAARINFRQKKKIWSTRTILK